MKPSTPTHRKLTAETALARAVRAGCRLRSSGGRVAILIPATGVGIRSWGVLDYLVARGARLEREGS